jgi:hypothetical protein
MCTSSVRRPALALYIAAAAAMVALAAAPARAQFQPRPLGNPAVGESYHVEGFFGVWFPTADMVISSEQLGILGSQINLKTDLGLMDQRFPEFRLVLRPARKHKFRLQLDPLKYTQSATITRDIVFNGQKYVIGIPVDSTLDWKAYRIGYEYDFISRDRGFGGVVVEAKYTDIQATLSNAFASEFARARAPIPAIGGIARVYPVPNVGITAEVTGFKLPNSKNYQGHYVDVDVYGTLNVNENVGAQIGYRSLDLGYAIKSDSGTMKLKGLYVGIVARY